MKSKPARTFHDGANTERKAILAKVRRAKKIHSDLSTAKLTLDELEKWLLQRNERYKKNPGGL